MNPKFKKNNWEPFATSTPLKAVSKNVLNNDLVQEPLIKPSDTIKNLLSTNHGYFPAFQNLNSDKIYRIPETIKKNKSSYMLYVSYSSEDECSSPSNKGSGIKISCESNKATKLIFKKSKDNKNDLKLVDKNSLQKNVKVGSKSQMLNKKINSRKNSYTSTKLKKNQTINKLVKSFVSDSVLEKENLSGHGSNVTKHKQGRQYIQDTSNLKKKKEITSPKQVSHQVIESFEKLCEKSVVMQNKLYEIVNNNHLNESIIFKQKEKDSETSGDINILNKQNSNLLKAKMIKAKTDKFHKSHNRKRKIKDAIELPTINTTTEFKDKNLSHQLFSESKEQELINNFSLTATKPNEDTSYSVPLNVSNTFKNSKENLIRKKIKKPEVLPNKIIETVRPVRIKKQPRKYWLLENSESECFKPKKPKKIKKVETCEKILHPPKPSVLESDVMVCSLPIKLAAAEKNDCISNIEVVNEYKMDKNNFTDECVNQKKKKRQCTTLSDKIPKEKKKENNNNNNDVESAVIFTKSSENSSINEKIKEKNEAADFLCENKKNSKPLKTQDVFKKLNQLSFKEENQQGCSVSEVWFLKNLKCGVFKVQKNFSLTHKTKFKNSYLGGVLLKGRLSVTIGEKTLDLQEGDMIFVPPLTNWSANNTSVNESVFYYWCGRFRI